MDIWKPQYGAQINIAHPLSRGLIACYLLNEGTGNICVDSSKYRNNGVVAARYSRLGGLDFSTSRSNDEIVIPDNTVVDALSNQITVIASAIPDSAVNDNVIVSKRSAWSATGIPFEMSFQCNASQRHFRFVVVGNTDVSADSWTRYNADGVVLGAENVLAGAWDGANIRYYINGLHVKTSAKTGTITANDTDVYIGSLPSGGEGLDGCIRWLMIYNRALHPDEIKSLSVRPFQMFAPMYNPVLFGYVTAGGTDALPIIMQSMNHFNGGIGA